MNAAQAREIVAFCEERGLDFFNFKFSEADYKEAKGYLSALEGPEVKALVEAATILAGFMRAANMKFRDVPEHLQPFGIVKKLEEALAAFREAVKL